MPVKTHNGRPLLIDLALQGGGSHGAFTWGVLDRLLEEGQLRIEAISRTSAGAMNAAVLAHGWIEGEAAGARAALDACWDRVETAAAFSPLQRTPLDRLFGCWSLDNSPVFIAFDNPRERPGTPRSAAEILNRLNEVSFNATLMKELRMIPLMRQVADPGSGEGKRWSQMRMHRITTELMTDLGFSSKLNGERDFPWMLRDEGRRAASAFLERHASDLGHCSTTDIDVLLAEC